MGWTGTGQVLGGAAIEEHDSVTCLLINLVHLLDNLVETPHSRLRVRNVVRFQHCLDTHGVGTRELAAGKATKQARWGEDANG